MARPIITLAIFFISLSLFSGMLSATGVAEDLGLNSRLSGGEAADDAASQAQNVNTGAPTGSTLFGMYNVLSSQLATLLGIFNPGLRMLFNAGVPAFIVGGPNTIGLLPPLATIVQFWGIARFLRGI